MIKDIIMKKHIISAFLVFIILFGLFANPLHAEDITEELLLDIVKYLPRRPEEASEPSFIYCIKRNRAVAVYSLDVDASSIKHPAARAMLKILFLHRDHMDVVGIFHEDILRPFKYYLEIGGPREEGTYITAIFNPKRIWGNGEIRIMKIAGTNDKNDKKVQSIYDWMSVAALEHVWQFANDKERKIIIKYGWRSGDVEFNFKKWDRDLLTVVLLEYLYNSDKHEELRRIIAYLSKLEFYHCTSLLKKLRDEFKEADAGTLGEVDNTREIDLLEKTIKEFKAQNAPQFEWDGLIRKWPKTERKIETPQETNHDDDTGLILD